jgi:predicted nucleic acid-binding protein
MLLIDTSVWINMFCDRSGQVRQQLELLESNMVKDEKLWKRTDHDY